MDAENAAEVGELVETITLAGEKIESVSLDKQDMIVLIVVGERRKVSLRT